MKPFAIQGVIYPVEGHGKMMYSVFMNQNLVPICWDDARNDFRKLNRELADIIDELDPSKEFRLYRARYKYGSEYVRSGRLFLPDKHGNLTHVNDPNIPKQVQDDLSYNLGSNPVSFITSKVLELYMAYSHRPTPVPFVQVPPGVLFSTSGVLKHNMARHHPAFLWNISAGSRSIFMLPKISKTKNYRKLRRLHGYSSKPPENINQHWGLFKDLYDNDLLGEWNLEVIFFSKKWFDDLDSKKFYKFKMYMKHALYDKLTYWSSQQIWNSYFSVINNISGIRPDPYVYDTVRHLLLLSMGLLPGMAPSTDDHAAPTAAIQKIFKNDYKLDKYIPVIMQPSIFNPYEKSDPIYYSLHYANAHELAPLSNENSSTILDLYEVKSLLQLYLRKMKSNEPNISGSVMSDIPHLVDFDFFHSAPQNYRDIRKSVDLFREDQRFSRTIANPNPLNHDTQEHPKIASFVRGCVRIAKKNDETVK